MSDAGGQGMLARWPLHAVLLPVASVFVNYASGESPLLAIYFLPCLISAGVAAISLGVVHAVVRDLRLAGLAATTLVPVLLCGGTRPGWVVVSGAGLVLVAWVHRRLEPWVMEAANVLMNLLSILFLAGSLWSVRAMVPAALSWVGAPAPSVPVLRATDARPDVWEVVLDGYGSPEFLGPAFGCAGALRDDLTRRGFAVPERARSNYAQTLLSTSSMYNLDYLDTLLPDDAVSRAPVLRLLGRSRLVEALRGLRYEAEFYPSDYSDFRVGHARIVQPTVPFGFIDAELASSSVLGLFGLGVRVSHGVHRWRARWTLARAAEAASHADRPTFRVVHLLAPHPPFVTAEDGGYVADPAPGSIQDAEHWRARHADAASYAEGYCRKRAWIDRRVLELVDTILAGARTPPVIVVHGDHGPGRSLSWSVPPDDATERFGVFLAVLAPPAAQARLRDDMTLVNVYRAVLSGAFGADLAPLPDRSFYSAWDTPLEFVDVTRRFAFDTLK